MQISHIIAWSLISGAGGAIGCEGVLRKMFGLTVGGACLMAAALIFLTK